MEKMYYSFCGESLASEAQQENRKCLRFLLCQPLSNWLIHPVLQLGPRRRHAAFAHMNYRMSRRPFQIARLLFIPDDSIFPALFFFPVISSSMKNTLMPSVASGSSSSLFFRTGIHHDKSTSDFKAMQPSCASIWRTYPVCRL